MHSRAAALAGIVAGIMSTLVQVALWLVFTDAFPAILFRDARLAAAIVLGPQVLDAAHAGTLVTAVATGVHFALSIAYGFVVAWLVRGRHVGAALAVGAGFGAALFLVNLYGFTRLFPWFAVTRDPITFAAHVAFGICAALAYRSLETPTRSSRSRSA